MHGYYSEMNESRPADAVIDAHLSHYGKHYFIKTPLVLKGRGIEYRGTLKAEELTPMAQHKTGWHEYIVTLKAMERLEKEHKVAIEMLL
jgi:hypothetical protein